VVICIQKWHNFKLFLTQIWGQVCLLLMNDTSTNVCFEKCLLWQMSAVTNVCFDKCALWQMSALTNVRFDECLPHLVSSLLQVIWLVRIWKLYFYKSVSNLLIKKLNFSKSQLYFILLLWKRIISWTIYGNFD